MDKSNCSLVSVRVVHFASLLYFELGITCMEEILCGTVHSYNVQGRGNAGNYCSPSLYAHNIIMRYGYFKEQHEAQRFLQISNPAYTMYNPVHIVHVQTCSYETKLNR